MDSATALHPASASAFARLEAQCVPAGARRSTTAGISPSTRAVGFWSAVLATVCAVSYDGGQICEWLGWLGSGGGLESLSTPLGIAALCAITFPGSTWSLALLFRRAQAA